MANSHDLVRGGYAVDTYHADESGAGRGEAGLGGGHVDGDAVCGSIIVLDVYVIG